MQNLRKTSQFYHRLSIRNQYGH